MNNQETQITDFDYDTTQEAKDHIGSMYDLETLEGERLFEDDMRRARIRERDLENNAVGNRIIVGEGRVTLRDSNGIECEIETSIGPRLLTFKTPLGLVNDRIKIVLIRD